MKIIIFIITLATVVAKETSKKAARSVSDRHYIHTALGINCLKCPPGQYMKDHCTEDDHMAQCQLCQEGSFQTDYTLAESCESCRQSCKTDREILVQNCSRTTNNYCVCKPEFYRDAGQDGLCFNYESCRPGMGVKEMGTPNSDTKCELCKEGFFSPNNSRTQICQPCSKCEQGFKPKEPCLKDSDTVCVPENNFDLPVILGAVFGGVILIFVIVLVIVIVMCRKRKRFRKLCCLSKGDSYDPESSAEKTPLSEKSPKNNGVFNDVVDKPESPNGIKYVSDPPGVVSDKTLVDLSQDLISPNWQFFFRQLFDDRADTYIEQTIINNKDVKEQIYKLLKTWKNLKHESATLNEILVALSNSDRNDLVLKYSPNKSTNV